ncbi:MAG: hypothetical protein P9L99_08980 [Candidatus Lernaella stagnicola]|nr:hypothetical protein [Candidatus Lernaella stagnicola]
MKKNWYLLLSVVFVVMAMTFGVTCGDDDDDDDDDDDGAGGPCAEFCSTISECGLAGLIGAVNMDDCQQFCEFDLAADVGNCVMNAENCAAAEACLETADDDDDDTAGDDDTTGDDDTGGDDDDDDEGAPVVKTPVISLAADGFSQLIWSETNFMREFNEVEQVFIGLSVTDLECDLNGGKMYYSLDEGGSVEYDTIPSYIKCSEAQAGTNMFGYYLNEIEGAMERTDSKAPHIFRMWVEDSAGHMSNQKTYSYEVQFYNTNIGGTMSAFETEPLLDKDGNEINLSDLSGRIVVFTSFAKW